MPSRIARASTTAGGTSAQTGREVRSATVTETRGATTASRKGAVRRFSPAPSGGRTVTTSFQDVTMPRPSAAMVSGVGTTPPSAVVGAARAEKTRRTTARAARTVSAPQRSAAPTTATAVPSRTPPTTATTRCAVPKTGTNGTRASRTSPDRTATSTQRRARTSLTAGIIASPSAACAGARPAG
ncbi:hypothetical protein [Georgenia sp. SUBG003]|uniref:hypothetical protein n=1 Tax=Georgenia sp. SUBG003 TaxID=1497974 RepID=UPI003AB684ED